MPKPPSAEKYERVRSLLVRELPDILSNKETARRLGMSPATVRHLRGRGVPDLGLVPIDELLSRKGER